MEAAVKSRPNHYEILGVKPTAASHEIVTAFAWQSSSFRAHSFGGMAEVCMAYATLRDPIKRRAYDASIGLEPGPQSPGPKPFVHPALGSLKTASPRKPVAGGTGPVQPERELRHRPELAAEPRIEPETHAGDYTHYFSFDERLAEGAREVDWKRTSMMLGGVILAACLVGGIAGWWSTSDIGETQQAAKAAPVPLPEVKQFAEAAISQPAPADAVAARPDPPTRPVAARTMPVAARPEPVAARPQFGSESQPLERPVDEPVEAQMGVSEGPASATPAASPGAASLPLPNRVVARTIERIGYSCGAVASTTAIEGAAPGVYKVTCTSGQSYQAKPVKGRYRFRRLDRQ